MNFEEIFDSNQEYSSYTLNIFIGILGIFLSVFYAIAILYFNVNYQFLEKNLLKKKFRIHLFN